MADTDIRRGSKKSILDAKLQQLKEGSAHHFAGDYVIPGESTVLYRIQKRNGVDAFTVVEIASPESADGENSEATIALMRPVDSDSGGPEFMDLYNNGYSDSRQMGIRIQSRGAGVLRDFVFDFNDGSGVFEVLRIRTNGIRSTRNIGIVKENAAVELYTADGIPAGTLKRVGARLVLDNPISGVIIDFHDSGYNQAYLPDGLYIYTDNDTVYLNDVAVKLLPYPVGAIYLAAVGTNPDSLFGGTWESITPPTGISYAWKRTA